MYPTHFNIQTQFEPFTYGQKYLDRFRKFPYINEGFKLIKTTDNSASTCYSFEYFPTAIVTFGISTNNASKIIGFINNTISPGTIPYGFIFNADGTYSISYNNTYYSIGSYLATDIFTLALDGTYAFFYRNGVLVSLYSRIVSITSVQLFCELNTINDSFIHIDYNINE